VKLEFSGAPEITAPKHIVWQRLIDPRFVARSAPGVESVEVIDANHFRVVSGFGPRAMKARITLDGELFDLVPGESAKMRLRGNGPGTLIEVLSMIAVHDVGMGKVRLHWTASSELSGRVANLGAKLLEGVARKMTEQFWDDFARRVGEEETRVGA
jgi:carbon monoxide dehydrogenase subunit G